MIVSNRSYPGAKVATIHTQSFKCVVSTAKEGVFQKQSTMIIEGDMVQNKAGCRNVGKLIYTDAMSYKDRLNMHDAVAEFISRMGDEGGFSLYDSLDTLIIEFKRNGILKEGVNLA